MPTMLGLVGVLLTLATLFAVINQKTLKLPLTIGVLLFTLVTSGLVMGLNALTPHQAFLSIPREILDTINLPSWLLDGALAILLFAGAMQVDLDHLIRRKFSIVALAILGTVLAVLLLALAAWLIFPVLGVHVPISWCILLGAILAPTDPVSVVGMLRRLGLPPHLQAIFAGESLFNDGVGIVIFTLAIGVATGETATVTPGDVFMGFLHEAGGGIVLGVMTGWLMLQIVRTVDDAHIHQRWSPFFGQGDKLSSGLNEDGFYGQGYAETVCGRVQV
ncbi:cation:proton antiporter domain-containing protein, partial [Acetobacter estunensis]